ncbi:hypothetical protein TSTA_010570 [Talaromyces stipitatus ATCC 10500]|uniref:Uncharacterized protein n=1 Tax=Talaromyces stipitatus (strain ATCC 10500 / CBS 375.48 / QM 6759 / NRRL 1006) TaxID=441959 RepID=B8MG73_TALSN|nr:uncharacterized protein TSTA_010570 [Talaromyces stipitatus ATCC 10500]EED15940.1 hypothetical protein TSTA_010570 [Talaromyces stipitatus ATCC 10500]
MSNLEMRLARFILGNNAPPCDHAPVACVPDPDNIAECLVAQLQRRWHSEPRPFHQTEHPLVFAIWQAGYDRHKAQWLASEPGYGMTSAPELVRALKKVMADERLNNLPTKDRNDAGSVGAIRVCDQCKPGTNTWSYCAPYNVRQNVCRRVPIKLDLSMKSDIQEGGKVLCLGRNGATKYCCANEFMAISHVWSHGWQGSSEDGLCSRVLDMLLEIASTKFDVNWIWLDVAMISKDETTRAMSVNSMDTVYSTAKATLVVDRVLLNFHPVENDDKQTALAITASDWMTRLWTMQEAMLSQNLLILTNRSLPPIDPRQLLNRIILAKHDLDRWKQYRAIKILSSMTHDPKPSLHKIVNFSYERTTTKPVDMVRALYPLFGLKWPSSETTLIEGQILLLKHLGQEAAILTSLSSPIGLPSPWGWAPLVIPGASGGGLGGYGRYVSEQDGLMGAWSWLEIVPTSMTPQDAVRGRVSSGNGWMEGFKQSFRDSRRYRSSNQNQQPAALPNSVSGILHYTLGIGADIFKSGIITTFSEWGSGPGAPYAELSALVALANGGKEEEYITLLTYVERDPWPWPNRRLFFIASADLSLQIRDSALQIHETAQYLDLVVVESEENGWFVMRRVGKAVTAGVKLRGEHKEGIQGVLH